MCGVDTKETYLEVLCFRQFYKHFVFVEDEVGSRNKRSEKYFEVSAVVDVGCGDTKEFVSLRKHERTNQLFGISEQLNDIWNAYRKGDI